jgi:hypothetical protein
MATPEGRVKEQVKRILKRFRVWYFMPSAGTFSVSGVPDFVGCCEGKFFTVETKEPNVKKPRRLQSVVMRKIRDAGGKTFVVAGDDGQEELEQWLEENEC